MTVKPDHPPYICRYMQAIDSVLPVTGNPICLYPYSSNRAVLVTGDATETISQNWRILEKATERIRKCLGIDTLMKVHKYAWW